MVFLSLDHCSDSLVSSLILWRHENLKSISEKNCILIGVHVETGISFTFICNTIKYLGYRKPGVLSTVDFG